FRSELGLALVPAPASPGNALGCRCTGGVCRRHAVRGRKLVDRCLFSTARSLAGRDHPGIPRVRPGVALFSRAPLCREYHGHGDDPADLAAPGAGAEMAKSFLDDTPDRAC